MLIKMIIQIKMNLQKKLNVTIQQEERGEKNTNLKHG